MGRNSKDEVTPMSRAIIDVSRDLLGQSDMSALRFFEESGFSSNYWYKRMRYEAPFTTSDVDRIADVFATSSLAIYIAASKRVKE